MSKDTFWFKHDSNASRDTKTLEMRSVYGYEGYGLYWAILEYLREQPGYKLAISERFKYKTLAGVLGFDENELEVFIEDSINEFKLFEFNGGFLYSESLIKRMNNWEVKKQNGSKGGSKIKAKSKRNSSESQANEEAKLKHKEKRREERNIYHEFISEFNSITGKSCKGDRKSQLQFLARIGDGYTPDQLLFAVKACKVDQYHMENPKYLTPEFITRPDKLEKYLNTGSLVMANLSPEESHKQKQLAFINRI